MQNSMNVLLISIVKFAISNLEYHLFWVNICCNLQIFFKSKILLTFYCMKLKMKNQETKQIVRPIAIQRMRLPIRWVAGGNLADRRRTDYGFWLQGPQTKSLPQLTLALKDFILPQPFIQNTLQFDDPLFCYLCIIHLYE